MPFFSWFKSKPESPEVLPEPSVNPKTASTAKPLEQPNRGPRRSRLRDTIPQEELIASVLAGGPGRPFTRPQRATVDVPLASILAGLPLELRAESRLSLAKQVQMPRRDLQIIVDRNTASTTVAALYAACPDIFSVPIDPGDTRQVTFSLVEPPSEVGETGTKNELNQSAPKEIEIDQLSFPTASPPDLETVLSRDLSTQETEVPEPEGPNLVGKTNGQHEAAIPSQISIPGAAVHSQLEVYLKESGTDAGRTSVFQIPFALIQPQLATGRITVPAHLLVEQLPSELRAELKSLDPLQPINLPLRDIIPQLPTSVVQPRDDQEPEIANLIATPFSQVAQQDALRFRSDGSEQVMAEDEMQLELGGEFQLPPPASGLEAPGKPAAHLSELPLEDATSAHPESAAPALEPDLTPIAIAENVERDPKISEAPAEMADLTSLPSDTQTSAHYVVSGDLSGVSEIFLWDEDYDLGGVIERLGHLPGLESAVVYSPAGKVLAGNLGEQIPQHVVTALLPPLFAAARQRLRDVSTTELETLTFAWQREQISLFWQENLCLAVRHSNRPFKPGVREKLVSVLKELAAHVVVSEA